jgi:pteridine reductase
MNQAALITGASKRVGKAIAEHLAEKGWNIAIHFNSSEKPAEVLIAELSSKYPHQNSNHLKPIFPILMKLLN